MADAPRLMTIARVATDLGVCNETVRRLIRRGDLGCYKLGGLIRVSPEQVGAYLAKIEQLPQSNEAEQQTNDVLWSFRSKLAIRRALEKAT